MKYSKAETIQKTHHLPTLKFEDQQLTSFSGLLLFQQLFNVIDLRENLPVLSAPGRGLDLR